MGLIAPYPTTPARGILVPQPGTEPVTPTLEGRLLSIGPQGRSLYFLISWHGLVSGKWQNVLEAGSVYFEAQKIIVLTPQAYFSLHPWIKWKAEFELLYSKELLAKIAGESVAGKRGEM